MKRINLDLSVDDIEGHRHLRRKMEILLSIGEEPRVYVVTAFNPGGGTYTQTKHLDKFYLVDKALDPNSHDVLRVVCRAEGWAMSMSGEATVLDPRALDLAEGRGKPR